MAPPPSLLKEIGLSGMGELKRVRVYSLAFELPMYKTRLISKPIRIILFCCCIYVRERASIIYLCIIYRIKFKRPKHKIPCPGLIYQIIQGWV